MAILKHITFTGIGVDTDLKELKAIQDEYPFVEWGVLISKNWQENGPRFFDPSQLHILRYSGLNLSCHLCGFIARDWIPKRGGKTGLLQLSATHLHECETEHITIQHCQIRP